MISYGPADSSRGEWVFLRIAGDALGVYWKRLFELTLYGVVNLGINFKSLPAQVYIISYLIFVDYTLPGTNPKDNRVGLGENPARNSRPRSQKKNHDEKVSPGLSRDQKGTPNLGNTQGTVSDEADMTERTHPSFNPLGQHVHHASEDVGPISTKVGRTPIIERAG
jgi:hypothetical protein